MPCSPSGLSQDAFLSSRKTSGAASWQCWLIAASSSSAPASIMRSSSNSNNNNNKTTQAQTILGLDGFVEQLLCHRGCQPDNVLGFKISKEAEKAINTTPLTRKSNLAS
eukprot:6467409-Amphidinium_carterae.1